jgi:hypothetical protein
MNQLCDAKGNRILMRMVAFIVCFSMILSLLGCKGYYVDGPGMEFTPPWQGFSLTSSHTYAQYNFWFTVMCYGEDYLLTGGCRDDEGNIYEEETGIKLRWETMMTLFRMGLEKQEIVTEPDPIQEELELEILDGSNITLHVTLPNGEEVEVAVGGEEAIQIYKLLLPYFIKHCEPQPY